MVGLADHHAHRCAPACRPMAVRVGHEPDRVWRAELAAARRPKPDADHGVHRLSLLLGRWSAPEGAGGSFRLVLVSRNVFLVDPAVSAITDNFRLRESL